MCISWVQVTILSALATAIEHNIESWIGSINYVDILSKQSYTIYRIIAEKTNKKSAHQLVVHTCSNHRSQRWQMLSSWKTSWIYECLHSASTYIRYYVNCWCRVSWTVLYVARISERCELIILKSLKIHFLIKGKI